MKTLQTICLIATIFTFSACGKSSNDSIPAASDLSAPAPAETSNQEPLSAMRLNNSETTVGSAIAYVANGFVTAVISQNASMTCDAVRKGQFTLPTQNYVTFTLPAKVQNYGTLDLAGMTKQRIVFGFNMELGNSKLPAQFQLNVKDVTDNNIAIDVFAITAAGSEYVKGSFNISICKR